MTALPESENIVRIDFPAGQQDWEPGIRFGVYYFLEHCRTMNGIRVNIVALKTNPVDTSQVIVAYVVTRALNSLFNAKDEEPFFDRDKQVFCFPK